MKTMIKNALILTAITLVAGILLGMVYEITKGPIAVAKDRAKKEAYQTVMKEADTFVLYEKFDADEAKTILEKADISGCRVDEIVVAKVSNDMKGYVITVTTSEGYGGDIQISMGITFDGTLEGIEILSISETAGLGMQADTPEFKSQYAEKTAENFVVTKEGAEDEHEIDAISSATITTKAITNAINAGVAYYHHELGGNLNE